MLEGLRGALTGLGGVDSPGVLPPTLENSNPPCQNIAPLTAENIRSLGVQNAKVLKLKTPFQREGDFTFETQTRRSRIGPADENPFQIPGWGGDDTATGFSFSRAPSEAHIHVLQRGEGSVLPNMGWAGFGTHPFAAALSKIEHRPCFSGNAQDLPRFRSDWEEYLKVTSLLSPPGTPIPDALLIRVFKTCLNEGNAVRLDSMLRQNPRLTMGEVWKDLEQRYGEDVGAQERIKWVNIRLIKTGTKPREVTLSDWERFESIQNIQCSKNICPG